MCGVIGVVSNSAANQLLYDGLMVLQHRGQDAAGIVTAEESRFHMHKGQGLVRDVFRTRDMRNLLGDMGVGARALSHRRQSRRRRPKRSRSTSIRPTASCWATTATSPTPRS